MKINPNSQNFYELKNDTSTKKKSDNNTSTKDSVTLNSSQDIGDYLVIPRPNLLRSSASKEENIAMMHKELEKNKVQVEEDIPLINGFTVKLDATKKAELEKKGFVVYEDKVENWIPEPGADEILENLDKEKPMLDNAMATIKKENPMGIPGTEDPICKKYTGKGVGIAIIDTGIYPHPDVSDRIVGWKDFVDDKSVPYDDGGHGTHVAGDAAGSGKVSGGKFKGFAPDANLVGIKVLGQNGGKTSDVIKGISWAIENKDKYNIKVVNMSLGHPAEHYAEDPTDIAVEQAVKAGLTVVVAAGNSGPEPGTISAPGDSPFAITVGAVDDKNTPDRADDTITPFSSRGPTPDGLVKPDIVAPGESIIAPLSPGSKAEGDAKGMKDRLAAYKWMSTLPDEQLMAMPDEALKLYGFSPERIADFRKSPEGAKELLKRRIYAFARMPLVMGTAYIGMPGTSMATPITAGVIAAMYEANPELTPYQVKNILMSTADKLPGVTDNDQGSGYLDASEALHKAEDLKNAAKANKIAE